MSQYRVVLLGVIGAGKTTLFNHLTSNKEFVRSGGDSTTKQVVVGVSNIVDCLEIIDTPGFQVDEDKIMHAAGVIAALTMGKLNRILIIQKFEKTSIMISSLKQIISPIRRFRDKITILVSHWDNSENKDEDKINIQNKIKENFNIDSIIFYSKNENPQIISPLILRIIKDQNNMTIELTDTEIYSQFDLLTLDTESQNALDQDKVEIVKKFRQITQIYLKHINFKINLNDSKAIDILHCMQLDIKNVADSLVEEFDKKHGEYMNQYYQNNKDNFRYLHHIYLKKAMVLDLENIIKIIQEKMTKTKNNFYQYLRQCPNCKLIWMKVVGCDNQTTCGDRVNSFQDNVLTESTNIQRYTFSIVKGELQVKEINPKEKPPQIEPISFEDLLYRLVKNDQNFKDILGNKFNQDSLIKLIKSKIGINFYFKNLQYSLGSVDNQYMIQYLYEQCNIKKTNQREIKQFGCGQTLIWHKLPLLTGSELNELLSTELIDYFSNNQQLVNDESKYLEQIYKDQVNKAIQDQINNAKYLPIIN